MKKIIFEDLLNFTKNVLNKAGLDIYSKNAVAEGLCETSLRGVDSHGIKLLPHYVKSAESGRKNPKPKYVFSKKFPSIGCLDADNAFGHAAGSKAIDYCIKMARINGIGAVSVFNSSHAGALAYNAIKAANKGYIAFAFTNADSLMLSHNGINPFFGTNPICFAAPRKEKEPFCLDMATSMISWNKLLNLKNKKLKLERNLAANSKGNIITDPKEATSLIAAGFYKGFALASMVEILCGVYSGMNFGDKIPPMYTSPINLKRKLAQFYIVLRIDGCISAKDFIANLQLLTKKVRLQKSKKNKKVMMPNDPEIANKKNRIKNGIPIDEDLLLKLNQLSKKYNTKLSLINK